MRGFTRDLLAFGGAAVLAAGLFLAGQGLEAPLSALAPTAPSNPLAIKKPGANPLEVGEEPAPAVATDLVPPAVGQSTALQRVAPRKPLSPPPAEDMSPEPTLLHRPVALAAGRIEAGGHRIEIAGLRITEPDRSCPRAGGGSWPCGAVARTAFRNWLRGRAVACVVAKKPIPESVRAPCAVGKADVGAWLAEQGWAEADGDGYAAVVEAAKQQGRGMFGSGPGPGI